jgi:hypothetical protein
MEVSGSLDVKGLLETAQNTPIPIDSLVIELRRTSDSTVAYSETISVDSITVSADGDTVSVDIRVSLSERSEEFFLYLAVVGDGEIWFVVHDVVTASVGSEPTVTEAIQPEYVGPGANATDVAISLSDTTITGGDSVLVTGTVYETDTHVDGALVWFESSDTSMVPTPRQVGRNQAWVMAPTAFTDSVTITAVCPVSRGTISVAGMLHFFARPSQLISVSGNNQEVYANTAAAGPIVVQVLDAAGDPFTYGFPVAFSVASGPAGTTVSPDTAVTDTEGYAQANITAGSAEGTIQVNATAQGLSGSPVAFNATVLENLGPVASVSVTPDSAVVTAVGDSVQYTAACQDSIATPVSCGVVNWMSLAPSVATVDTLGWAHSHGAGVAGIVAAAGGFADTAQFVVNGIGSLTVAPADTVITAIGDSLTLTVSGEMVLGGTVSIPNDSVVWQTLTPAVAITDSVGNTFIVGSGVATVRATLGTATGDATLRVEQSPASFAVLPTSPVIGVGGVVNLTGYTYDRNGYQVPGRSVGWLSLDNAIATVDATGRVTGVELGSVGIVGTDSSLADTAYVDVVTAPPQVLQWGADSISVGRGATLQQAILLSVPAPVGGVVVDVVSSDTLILKPTTPSVTFSSGQTSRTVTFQGRAAGRVTVTATDRAAGFAPDTLTVGVLSTMEFRNVSNPTTRATSFSINSAESRRALVFLSDPAPPGGLAVNIGTSDNLVAVGTPSPATIPGGQLSVEIDLQGTGVGSATLTPEAAGWVGLSSTITTSLAQFSFYIPSPYVARVGTGQLVRVQLNVPNTMDRDLTAQMATFDPSVGSVPDTVVIDEGRTNQYFYYEGLQPGLDTITANRSGWGEGRQAMLVTTPLVRPEGIGTLTAGGPNVFWRVYPRDSVGTTHVRSDTLTITVTSRDPSVLAVDVDTAFMEANASQATAYDALRPVSAGTTYLVASAPGHLSDSVLVTVNAPKLYVYTNSPYRTGTRQTHTGYVQLPVAAPSPVTVFLQSDDPGVVTVTDSLVYPSGSTSRGYTLSGVSPGTTSIIATAAGYEPDTVNFTVTTNRLTQSGLSSNYYITVGSDRISMRTADVNGSQHPTLDTVVVTLETTDPNVFTIDSTTVTVPAGAYVSAYANILFQNTGQAYVRWSAPGYATDSMSVTINPSPLSFYQTYQYRAAIGQYATPQVRIPSPSGLTDTTYVLFSHPGTPRGAVPDTVKIAPGSYYSQFRWAGTAVGYDTITASATNFVDGTASMLITRPWLFAYNLPSGVVVNDTFNLRVYTTDSTAGTGSTPYNYTTHPVTDTLPVTVTSTDPLVIAVDSTPIWNIPAERTNTSIRLIASGPGTAQIIVEAADPWKHDTTNVVVVTAPAVTLNPASLTLGTGQQYSSYRAYIPNGVADTTYVGLVVSDTAVAGFSTDTVKIPPGSTYSPYFTVFAKSIVASVQITATAQGFSEGTSVLIVNTPTLDINTTTTGYVGGPSATLTVYTDDETGDNRDVWNDLEITLTSTNPGVLSLDSTTVTVLSGDRYTRATWTAVAPGTAQIVATAPGYTQFTSDVITVGVPKLTLQSVPATLGVSQRYANVRVYIPFNMPGTDTAFVALSNSNPSALTLSTDTILILPGSSYSEYFTVVGAAIGTTTIGATALGFTESTLATVDVGSPVLYVNGPTSGTVGGSTSISAYTQDQAGNYQQVNQTETVTLTVSNASIADFGGQSSVQVDVTEGYYYSSSATLNYHSAGSVTITATLSGYTEGERIITVGNP